MGIAAEEIMTTPQAALAALAWQVDLGVAEVVQDTPQNAFDLPEAAPWARRTAEPPAPAAPRASAPPAAPGPDPVAAAHAAAMACDSVDALNAAIAAFDLCEIKRGARNTVFADGNPDARVMVVGEAPGRDEDLEGRPFVGRAGHLLDAMFAAIGLSRASAEPAGALYITNVMPWRPPGNRDPEPAEIAMMRPFVLRHIELAAPQIIVTLGNTPLEALTGQRGVLAARGKWTEVQGRPLMPMTHPAYLLRTPAAKREAWADLLHIKARLT
ncbi:MAG: uracil-DNA glycosylase [Paracoccaceae bacterium]